MNEYIPPNIAGVWVYGDLEISITQDKNKVRLEMDGTHGLTQTGYWIPRVDEDQVTDWDLFLVDQDQTTYGRINLDNEDNLIYQIFTFQST